MRFTVLGSQGFIGSHLAVGLRRAGHDVDLPPRDDASSNRRMGHVIYCIGVTADFRMRPFDTVTAHACKLNEILRDGNFESLTYLSSTRVYQGLAGTVDERTELRVDPNRPGDLYNLSKLLGESLALNSGRPTRIVRLSNVYGHDPKSENFLSSIVREAAGSDTVTLRSAAGSTKDYVSISDVIGVLPKIALLGRHRLYNVASGMNTTHAELAASLTTVLGCTVHFAPGAPEVVFPRISTSRLAEEFDWLPASLLDDLPALVKRFQTKEPAGC